MFRHRLLLLSCLGLAACSGETLVDNLSDRFSDDQAEAEADDAVASTDLTTLEASLLMAASDAVALDADADAIAAAIADAAGTTWSPSDCVMSESVGPNVTWTLNNCAGPRGFVTVSGVANLVVTGVAAGTVGVNLTATDLQVNGATMTINSTGDISEQDGMRRLDMTTSGAGTLSGGTIVGRAGTWNATFDASCLTLGGQWTTSINDDTFWNTAVTNLTKCGAACPQSGTITYTGVDNPNAEADINARNVTITFDGDATAAWVSTRGAIGNLPLACSP